MARASTERRVFIRHQFRSIHAAMVRRVMMAVKEGERSQNRLKTLALRAVDARE
jgi:hypothetical protein